MMKMLRAFGLMERDEGGGTEAAVMNGGDKDEQGNDSEVGEPERSEEDKFWL